MREVYRCLVCNAEFNDEEEVLFHLEHWDSIHSEAVERRGVRGCFQKQVLMEDGDDVTGLEELKSGGKEWTDYPKGAKIKAYPIPPEYVLYPYEPYYYSYKHKKYLCSVHDVETGDFKEFLKHMIELHEQDLKDFLSHHVRQQILHRIRVEKGSSMHLSEESISRMIDDELKELMITSELKSKPHEPMGGLVDSQLEGLRAFATGETSLCSLCNHDMEDFAESKQYELKKIMNLLKGQMDLGKVPKEYEDWYKKYGYYPYKVYAKRKYKGKWRGSDVDYSLRNVLHLHLSHGRISDLCRDGIASGPLVQWLTVKGYESNKPLENLSSVFDKPRPVEDTLNPAEKLLKRWLEKGQ